MLSSFQRFHNNKEMKPSPGSYNDPRSALEVTKRTTGLKRSPFGQTAVRFQPESHVKKTPGKKQKCILQLKFILFTRKQDNKTDTIELQNVDIWEFNS